MKQIDTIRNELDNAEEFDREVNAALHQVRATDRLYELAEADKDGCVVILPCKIGDTVYILQRRLDGSDCIRTAEFWWSDIPQIGKTVFLSREEAEKALKGKANE